MKHWIPYLFLEGTYQSKNYFGLKIGLKCLRITREPKKCISRYDNTKTKRDGKNLSIGLTVFLLSIM